MCCFLIVIFVQQAISVVQINDEDPQFRALRFVNYGNEIISFQKKHFNEHKFQPGLPSKKLV